MVHEAVPVEVCRRCESLEFRQELIEARGRWKSYEAQWKRAREREEALKVEHARERAAFAARESELLGRISDLEAALKYARACRFGRTGSKGKGKSEQQEKKKTKRKRGQQPGNPVPPRRPLDDLPLVEETVEVAAEDGVCPQCGLPYTQHPIPEVSEAIEIEVKGYRRRISRQRLVQSCQCADVPGLVTAPAIGSLFPGSQFGISFWVEVLVARYEQMMPINRVLGWIGALGYKPAPGTVHGNIPRLLEIMGPIKQAIDYRNRRSDHWHADETGHAVFVEIPGKSSQRWWLWVFLAADTVTYIMSPTRSTQVILDHLGKRAQGILSVDRFSSYACYAAINAMVVLALCWAHVRRDFLKASIEDPQLKEWVDAWIERIGTIYHTNDQRLQTGIDNDEAIVTAVADFKQEVDEACVDENLTDRQRNIMTSLQKNWDGLTVFVDNPDVPMDNNPAERALRMEVIGRKAFNGCGSLASAELLATMASIFGTLKRNNCQIRGWLTDYLTTCALHGGRPPPDISRFLPWNAMVQEQPWSQNSSPPPAGLN